ncbi:hypothetical protein WICPIJ_004126 [Wickerhamomyces pijperi]|uniref:Uncharacterized protein n=1 Tax=Wickerhamomyces pijperi TaxID=599730 RepID=A0A9P8Q5V5_WICPI|nr:hypothetical protein WICPIJ_004126 [Wickerhamomyces pijperi]
MICTDLLNIQEFSGVKKFQELKVTPDNLQLLIIDDSGNFRVLNFKSLWSEHSIDQDLQSLKVLKSFAVYCSSVNVN